jgi:hypothetical protein
MLLSVIPTDIPKAKNKSKYREKEEETELKQ